MPMRLSLSGITIAVLMSCSILSAPASGAILEIQFTGMDLVYGNDVLYDAGGIMGSLGRSEAADPLLTMVFLVDGVQQGIVTSDIAIDTRIADLYGIPAAGGAVVSGAGFVDLFTKSSGQGWGLALNVDSMSFFYTGNNIAIAAAGVSSEIYRQDLPFGLAFDESQPLSIVLSSANLTNVTTANGFVTGFRAAGTGSISGVLLPEPTTMLLVAIGGLALARRR